MGSIIEFPHAMASRLVKSGRATKFQFSARSLRLKQSLTIVRELGPAVSAELRLGVAQLHFVVAGASAEVSQCAVLQNRILGQSSSQDESDDDP